MSPNVFDELIDILSSNVQAEEEARALGATLAKLSRQKPNVMDSLFSKFSKLIADHERHTVSSYKIIAAFEEVMTRSKLFSKKAFESVSIETNALAVGFYLD